MKESVVHLQGNTSDLIIQTHPVVEILYWGEKISGVEVSAIQAVKRAVPNGRLDVDTPVTHVNTPSGISTSIFLRLFSLAPLTLIQPVGLRLFAGTGILKI
jgi:hypothetical protein